MDQQSWCTSDPILSMMKFPASFLSLDLGLIWEGASLHVNGEDGSLRWRAAQLGSQLYSPNKMAAMATPQIVQGSKSRQEPRPTLTVNVGHRIQFILEPRFQKPWSHIGADPEKSAPEGS